MLSQVTKFPSVFWKWIGGKEGILTGEEDQNMLQVYVQRQHNEIHQTLYEMGDWGYNRGGQLVHSTPYTCMELPQ
jgi:hypothetical protein